MSKTKETVNLKAANVEACRICLATDTKLHSLQSTYLATSSEVFALLEAVVGYHLYSMHGERIGVEVSGEGRDFKKGFEMCPAGRI
ncbi:hypothetical protein B5X24_HaOG215691, partial [Helicoverpa armigera]